MGFLSGFLPVSFFFPDNGFDWARYARLLCIIVCVLCVNRTERDDLKNTELIFSSSPPAASSFSFHGANLLHNDRLATNQHRLETHE